MKNLALKTLFLFSIATMLFACKKDDPKPPIFDIYIDFWNPTGTNPQIKLDETLTSNEIKIDFSKGFDGVAEGQYYTKVVIDNFRIIDANYINYSINQIVAYELSDLGEWRVDNEFTMDYERTRSLSVVMVLDRSESLGDDFENVKLYAVEFVNKLFEDTENNVRIGIVDFANEISSLPVTNNKTSIINYINGLQKGGFTRFYESVDLAIDMLTAETAAESKALLGFTDGIDNLSDQAVNSNSLRTRMVEDNSDIKISSFMIGLGGVDKTALEKLSVNGGASQFPGDAVQLQSAFDNFSSAIANVYNLTYTRNQQKIAVDNPAKLKFSIIPQ